MTLHFDAAFLKFGLNQHLKLEFWFKPRMKKEKIMENNSIFTVLALATSNMIDEASGALSKNVHHINNVNSQLVDGVIDTITSSVLSLLRHYSFISNDELMLEVNELTGILECADDVPFKDTITAIALTYAARNFRSQNNDDYYLVTVMRSYVNMLKTVCDAPLNNADEFICIDKHKSIDSLNLPFDFNWYLKPIEQKFFKVKFRDDFTFIFKYSEEYDFLCDICLMLSHWNSFGELLDNYTSSQFEKYTEEFNKTIPYEQECIDEYDVSIFDFIDFLRAEPEFNTFMNDHRFIRL